MLMGGVGQAHRQQDDEQQPAAKRGEAVSAASVGLATIRLEIDRMQGGEGRRGPLVQRLDGGKGSLRGVSGCRALLAGVLVMFSLTLEVNAREWLSPSPKNPHYVVHGKPSAREGGSKAARECGK